MPGFSRTGMLKWTLRITAALLMLAAVLALLAHTPPARRAVLRRAVAVMQDRFGVAVEARQLRYNLLALTIALDDVAVAADGPDRPAFFRADRIEVAVPRSALSGRFSLDTVRVGNGRLDIVRAADGTTNLPASHDDAGGTPDALDISHIDIPYLHVSFEDRPNDVSVVLPAVAIDVRPDRGTVRFEEPGRVRRGAVSTVLNGGGGVAFDGRALTLTRFELVAAEGALVVDGPLALLVPEPAMQLRLSGTVDVAPAVRWGTDAMSLDGSVRFDGSVQGPLAQPLAIVRVRSDRLTVPVGEAAAGNDLELSNVDADVRVDGDRLAVPRLETALAGGSFSLNGEIALGTHQMSATASWQNVDTAALALLAAPAAPSLPAARASGTAALRGSSSGWTDWTIDATTRLSPERQRAGRISLSGTARLQMADGTWRLDSTGFVSGAETLARLRGRFDPGSLRDSSIEGVVNVGPAELPRLLRALADADLLDEPPSQLTAGTAEVEARLSGSVGQPTLQLDGRGRALEIAGIPEVFADLTAQGTTRRLTVDARVRQQGGNIVVASGTVQPQSRELDMRVSGMLNEPARLSPGTPLEGTARLQVGVRGGFDALMARGTLSISDAAYANARLGNIETTIDLDRTAAQVTAVSEEFAAIAAVTLNLDGSAPDVIDVQIDRADLGRVVRDAALPLPVSGHVSLEAHAAGSVRDWRGGMAAIEVSHLDARAGDLPITVSRGARLTYGEETLDVERLEASIGETRLSVAGRLPVFAAAPAIVPPGSSLRAVLTGDVDHVLDAVAATRLVELPHVDASGPAALLVRLSGSLERADLAGDLELGPARLAAGDLPPVEWLQLRAHLENGWIEPISASGIWLGSTIDIRARAPIQLFAEYLPAPLRAGAGRAGEPAVLTARALSITPRVFEPFLSAGTVGEIEGSIDALVELTTPSLDADGVRGNLTVERLDVRVAGLAVAQREPTRVLIDRSVARVAAWDWTGQGATLGVAGQVRLADGIAALRTNGRADLRMLAPFLREAGLTTSGTLVHRLSINGPITDPEVEGEISLDDGSVRLADPRVVVTDLAATASVSRDAARLTSLDGAINGGSLSGTGQLEYGGDAPASARLTAAVSGMALEFPQGLRSELDADVTLALSASPPAPSGSLTGSVTVTRSAYREPIAVVTGVLEALQRERLAARSAPADSFADRLALDVRVVTEEDVIVANNLARLQLGGDLRVIGTAAAPALSGRATLREGGELFLGRNRYQIDSGTIDFANPDVVEPDLNIEARTRAGGEEIGLALEGTPDTLEVELESISNPGEMSQADLASLLLTGRRLDEVSGAEAQIVGEQVLSYLSGDILGAAGRVIGLDAIRLGGTETSTLRGDAAAIASETDPTSRLTFVKSLGDAFDVTLSQSLRDSDAQTWILDYRPTNQLGLRLVSGDDHLRTYEFRHDVSFAAAAARTAARPTPSAARETRVAAVRLTGDPGPFDAPLRNVLRLGPSDVFDVAEWQRDRDRAEQLLHGQGRREARVTASRSEDATGVTLTYQVDLGPPTTLVVRGFDLPEETRQAIEIAWTQSVFDDFLEEEVVSIVRRALGGQGYLQAAVMAEITTGTGNAARGDGREAARTLSITIEPGQRTRERQVVVSTDDDRLRREVEGWIGDERLADLAFRDSAALERLVGERLQALGYLSASVEAGAPAFEGERAVIAVSLRPGPVFVLRSVRIEGAERLAEPLLRDEAALEIGAVYNTEAVDGARTRMTSRYRRDGLVDARVTSAASLDAANGEVDLVFTVEEGPRQVLRQVRVTGNRSIDTDVITRALDLPVGESLGSEAWLAGRSRLFDTALFRRVDVTVTPLEDADPFDAERPVRVDVAVQEWPALRLRYGVQVAEERPESEIEGRELVPGLAADLTRRTLFGRAITVGGVFQYQRRERLARGFANAPTLFGLPIESIFSVEQSREEIAEATLVSSRRGVRWEQRVRITPAFRASYTYGFDRDHTFDTDPDPSLPFDLTVNVARLTGAVVYDTRDDPYDTIRGALLSSNVELAVDSLGSDVRFLRDVGQVYYFRPWRRVVLASAARVGLAKGLGGDPLIPSERFFGGGASTLRGIPEDGLGPRDFTGGAAGGGALLLFNQEVRFPIFRWVRGVGFADAGNVFETPSAMTLGGLVGSIGAGLRIATPFALLRADYGRAWTRDDSPSRSWGRWTFGIGQAF